MNTIDARCQKCGHDYRWLIGNPMTCPRCGHHNFPKPTTG